MSDPLRRREVGGTSYLTGGEGPPVVFRHGIPGSAFAWEPVASRLRDRHRVVVPDLRGFGQSDPPAGDYYMAGQARAVSDLLDALSIEVASLVAHDFGGPVGLTMLRLVPERSVDRLALAATNVFTDTRVPLPLRVAGVPLLGDLAFRLAVGNRVGLWLLYRAAVGQKGTATWPRFRRHLTPSGVTSTRRIFRRSLADLEANYAAVEETLSEVRVPGLVLWGDSDPFFPREVAERTRAALPDSDAELIVYDRTGHFVPEERPGAVASALREFLRPG